MSTDQVAEMGRALSEKQRACLEHFASVDRRGAADGYKFGSGTLSSLRKLGLLEQFRGFPWSGAKVHTMYRITADGCFALPCCGEFGTGSEMHSEECAQYVQECAS